ncbi:unnamed protein product [Symbiodinium sp. CCMP2592]|nr:unnamed protein product [Symbiodinium sp. CCMP2592]
MKESRISMRGFSSRTRRKLAKWMMSSDPSMPFTSPSSLGQPGRLTLWTCAQLQSSGPPLVKAGQSKLWQGFAAIQDCSIIGIYAMSLSLCMAQRAT